MTNERQTPNPPLWLVKMTAAMAGGMGWGIRGQYGHETGAMIAGVLGSLVLVFLFCPGNSSIMLSGRPPGHDRHGLWRIDNLRANDRPDS
ncbi:MAG: hypothetical protein Ct9H300mP7_6310 [Verrucomicrobiota bacterium]|nr:MAG: hypothetical protein Ct9H300mP7_6310 [Verrucomicrobiota bacterium]